MMPMMLSWVLGGNSSKLEGRPVCCRLSDKANDQLHTWFVEDDALERTINGEYNMFSQKEDYPGISIAKPLPEVSEMHAQFHHKDGAFFLTDLRSVHGTWITKLTMKEGDTGYLQMIKLVCAHRM
ncbi:Zeaxanthin epoxidase [Arachis hypogaea]|nr:Zeaxanthin epoxidase [Arachis hypogaea]